MEFKKTAGAPGPIDRLTPAKAGRRYDIIRNMCAARFWRRAGLTLASAAFFGIASLAVAAATLAPGASARQTAAPSADIQQVDTVVTYHYDANGNRSSEIGQSFPNPTTLIWTATSGACTANCWAGSLW